MPKTKQSATNRLNSFVLEYGTDIFKTDGSILFCKLCEVKINSDRKFVVTQHVNNEKHKRAVIRKNEKNKNSEIQQLVANTPKKCLFSHDLCKALLSANIPLYKISNPQLKSFLEKYTSREIPSDSTLRKTYVNDIYEETMKNIREQIKGNKIWVSIDETTDSEGRYVANVIIGTLNTDAPGKTYLLTTEVLEKANNSTIVKLFDHSMFVLWPNGIRHDDVLLFVTDAAPYMVKAGQTFQSLYSKMIHLTCLAHGIHRVAENIREKFKKVDKLISRVKQVFLKAPSRVLVFKSEAPATIPLPPEPILTRWGTWIIAASYYCKYYQVIRRVLLSLNAEDAISVKEAQQLIQEPDMEANLVYIHSNFGFIPEYITKLETQYISLSEALSAVKYVQNKLNDCEGEIGVATRRRGLQYVEDEEEEEKGEQEEEKEEEEEEEEKNKGKSNMYEMEKLGDWDAFFRLTRCAILHPQLMVIPAITVVTHLDASNAVTTISQRTALKTGHSRPNVFCVLVIIQPHTKDAQFARN
ncbi:hypothetical protein QTP88_026616 [Uroleucon formosanum]